MVCLTCSAPARSVAGSIVSSVLIVCLSAIAPAAGGPIVVDDAFDFTVGPQGWTAQPVGRGGKLPPASRRWKHDDDHWRVAWDAVKNPLAATGNYLTSPAIDASAQVGGGPVDLVRISLAHRFDFGARPKGATVPPSVGQISYSINGGPFVGIPLADFRSGSIDDPQPPFTPPLDPFPPGIVDQTALVVPTFVPPAGGYPDLFPLINDGASFADSTSGFSGKRSSYVPSIATIAISPTVITDLRIRLTNANLGDVCHGSGDWDVRYVQVDFATPEPGSGLLAGAGLAAGYGLRACRRRRLGAALAPRRPGRARISCSPAIWPRSATRISTSPPTACPPSSIG